MHKLIIHLLEIGGPTKNTDWKKLGEQFGFSAIRKGKAAQDCWRNYEKSLGKKNVIEFSGKMEGGGSTTSETYSTKKMTVEQQAKFHEIDTDKFEPGKIFTNEWAVGMKLKVLGPDGQVLDKMSTQPLHQLKVVWVPKKEASKDYQALREELQRSFIPKSFLSRVPEPGEHKSYLILPDVHRPYHNKFLWDAMLHFAQDTGFHGVVILGDYLDLSSISSHNKGKVVKYTLWDEYLDGAQGRMELEDAGGFREKHYLCGNHEDRLYRYIKDLEAAKLGQAIIGIEHGLGLDGWDFLNNWKEDYVQLGGLQIIHGENTGKQSLDKTLDDVEAIGFDLMYGHTHWFMSKQDNRGAVWNIGTMADLNDLDGLGYVSRFKRAKWRNGLATVVVDDQNRHFVNPILCSEKNFFANGKKY